MSSTAPNTSLVVLSFDSHLKAEEAYLALARLQTEAVVAVDDAVFLSKDLDGRVLVRETVDVSPGSAAVRSSFWGALLGTIFAGPVGFLVGGSVSAAVGALAASATDYGIQRGTLAELREQLQPGHTALAVLLRGIDASPFLREMERFRGATLLEATLPHSTEEALREALGDRSVGNPDSTTLPTGVAPRLDGNDPH